MKEEKKLMRHERKYLLSYAKYIELRQRLKAVLHPDENMQENEDYFIRSIYLDDIHNSAYQEKMAGVSNRKKYRIRSYNYDVAVIKLECKEKQGSRIHKESVLIDHECCEQIIHHQSFQGLEHRSEDLCKEVYTTGHEKGFHTSVIVDYDREAYVYPVSNVRITFDKDLHVGGIDSFSMDSKDLVTVPIYSNREVILEVKYDDVLPEYIRQLLSSHLGTALSISKYCICKERLEVITG